MQVNVMKRSMVLNALNVVLPAGVSRALITHDAQRDGTWMEQVSDWLKERCRDIYRSSVYCSACDYEIGANPQCAECAKVMKTECRQTSVSTNGLLA